MVSKLNDIAQHHPASANPSEVQAESSTDIKSTELVLDVTMRDRFELLSAYLDGEVTPHERRQVARWLSEDSGAQALYHRLLVLRQAMRSMPIESSIDPPPQVAVDAALRTAYHRIKIVSLAIVCTASAVILSNTNSLINPLLQPLWWVFSQPNGTSRSEPLDIVLDKPAIELNGIERGLGRPKSY